MLGTDLVVCIAGDPPGIEFSVIDGTLDWSNLCRYAVPQWFGLVRVSRQGRPWSHRGRRSHRRFASTVAAPTCVASRFGSGALLNFFHFFQFGSTFEQNSDQANCMCM